MDRPHKYGRNSGPHGEATASEGVKRLGRQLKLIGLFTLGGITGAVLHWIATCVA